VWTVQENARDRFKDEEDRISSRTGSIRNKKGEQRASPEGANLFRRKYILPFQCRIKDPWMMFTHQTRFSVGQAKIIGLELGARWCVCVVRRSKDGWGNRLQPQRTMEVVSKVSIDPAADQHSQLHCLLYSPHSRNYSNKLQPGLSQCPEY
jgi:hypothetical protein